MVVFEGFLYTADHEWFDPNTKRVGITYFAQESLGDVILIDLPKEGETFKKGEKFANVESVKSVSEVYAPVDMKILKVNDSIQTQPELINEAPYSDGWLVEVEVLNEAQLDDLMDAKAYKEYLNEQ